VFVAVIVVLLITVWFFYPETKGHTLEEMAVIFDGAEAAAPTESEVLSRVIERKGDLSGEVTYIENVA
jgi:hypothetical protein